MLIRSFFQLYTVAAVINNCYNEVSIFVRWPQNTAKLFQLMSWLLVGKQCILQFFWHINV